MRLRAVSATPVPGPRIATICPHCGSKGVFEVIGQDLEIGNHILCGQRRCPDFRCKGHLFVVVQADATLLFQYPPVSVAFNRDNIPAGILKTFEEAVSSHANACYVAAAMMIRRTLEEICDDSGANGKDLKERIGDLKTKVVLPLELFDAMHELRMLGNDAAHIQAKLYDQVSKPETDVAIEFAIELLKALYQYSTLLTRMKSLRKQTP